MLVSVIIPCYNSEHTISKVVEMVSEQFDMMPEKECEFVLVKVRHRIRCYGSQKKMNWISNNYRLDF